MTEKELNNEALLEALEHAMDVSASMDDISLRDRVALTMLPELVSYSPTNAAKAAYEFAEAFMLERHRLISAQILELEEELSDLDDLDNQEVWDAMWDAMNREQEQEDKPDDPVESTSSSD